MRIHPLLLALALGCLSCSDRPGATSDAGADAGRRDQGPRPDSGCPVTARPGPGLVITGRGAVKGVRAGKTWAFLGVPYAAPPLGKLRWRPPQPAACFPGTLEAGAWGPLCPQLDDGGAVVGREDCLQLNVWTPEPRPAAPAPVMVWIHGGGHIQGGAARQSGTVRIHDGRRLTEKTGAVVVTINYRLGALGYLAHAALTREDPNGSSGNHGTLDQLAALRWVQRNIAAFGGDPGRVLIFGESAGGVAVCTLVASPLGKGLFSAAAIQSGGCNASPLATSEAFGVKVFTAAGCQGAADPLACMRALPADKLLLAYPVKVDVAGKSSGYGSTIDGHVLADVPERVIAAGKHNPVPVIVGTTSDETSRSVPAGITSEQAFRAAVALLFPTPAVASQVLAQYPLKDYASPRAAYVALTSDAKFVCTARRALRAFARGQTRPAYRYLLSHRLDNGSALLRSYGAWHGVDVLYMFETLTVGGYRPGTGDQAVSDALAGHWSRLAAAGDPNKAGTSAWPAWSQGDDPHLVLDAPLSTARGVRTRQCDFWDTLAGL
jgi:para-nitrobenzyl esterase